MKEFAVYTAARLVLFAVTYAVVIGVYLAVSGGSEVPLFWPFLLAVIVSATASAVLLRRQREAFTAAVQRRADRAAGAADGGEQRSGDVDPGPQGR